MRILLSAALLATASMLCIAQEKVVTPPTVSPIIVVTTNVLPTEAAVGPVTPANASEAALLLAPVPTDPFLAMRIPLNSKIYIAPFKSEDSTKPVEGFETYMAAALRKKG